MLSSSGVWRVGCVAALPGQVEVRLDLDPLARGGALGQALDRRGGPVLVERGGAQLDDQRAQVGDLLGQALDGGLDRRAQLLVAATPRRLRARRAGRRGSAASRRAARGPSAGAPARRPRCSRAAAAPRPTCRWPPRSPRWPRTRRGGARPRGRSRLPRRGGRRRRARRRGGRGTRAGRAARCRPRGRAAPARRAAPSRASVDPLGPLRAQHRPVTVPSIGIRLPWMPRGSSPAPAATTSSLVLLEHDHQRARAHERPRALDDQLEDAVEVRLAAERLRDRHRRVEPAHGALEVVAAALDRRCRAARCRSRSRPSRRG